MEADSTTVTLDAIQEAEIEAEKKLRRLQERARLHVNNLREEVDYLTDIRDGYQEISDNRTSVLRHLIGQQATLERLNQALETKKKQSIKEIRKLRHKILAYKQWGPLRAKVPTSEINYFTQSRLATLRVEIERLKMCISERAQLRESNSLNA